MAKLLYCWRCQKDLPMLDESEWAQIQPAMVKMIEEIQNWRAEHGLALSEAQQRVQGCSALDHYFQLTGFRETDVRVIWHHRMSLYGAPCRCCGKPLRTPLANFCAACGVSAVSADN